MNDRLPSPIPAKAGVGLRLLHHQFVQERRPPVSWLEVHSENYIGSAGALRDLLAIRAHYPLSLHGVGLSLGSAGPLDENHLRSLRILADQLEPGLMSEHLSWSIFDGVYLNDLLPLPYTEEALQLFCAHVDTAQTKLRRKLLIENPSTYLEFHHSTMSEAEFLNQLVKKTGCGLLLDINNLYIASQNHGIDAHAYLKAIPADAVGEIHLAGHAVNRVGNREIRIDDHGSAVIDPVWDLYAAALRYVGPVPTLIEWDTNIPDFAVLMAEADKAQTVLDSPTIKRTAAE